MGAYATKQLIVIRKDLNMPQGKAIAQGAHASLASFMLDGNKKAKEEWLNDSYAKIALAVNSLEELQEVYQTAIDNNIAAVFITDNGTTVFNGVPTETAVGIGPEYSSRLDELFRHLKLYK